MENVNINQKYQNSSYHEEDSSVVTLWGPPAAKDYYCGPGPELKSLYLAKKRRKGVAATIISVKCFNESEALLWIRKIKQRQKELNSFLSKNRRSGGRENGDRKLIVLIKLSTPFMDYIGCYIGNSYVSTRCEVETALSWLSTLGGACSALGDLSVQFAQVAGQISMKQLKLAMKLDDPLIASRCRIYAALSLMQMGDLLSARKIIEKEYKYALVVGDDIDPKLRRMCLGVWAKLQYLWRNSKLENNAIKSRNTEKNDSITLSGCVLASITLARDNSDFLIPSAIGKASECK